MRIPQSFALSRTAGVLAIASLPAFVWVGWWQLAISLVLAITAAIVAPRHRLPTESRFRGWMRWLSVRTHPHMWRPGNR